MELKLKFTEQEFLQEFHTINKLAKFKRLEKVDAYLKGEADAKLLSLTDFPTEYNYCGARFFDTQCGIVAEGMFYTNDPDYKNDEYRAVLAGVMF